MAEAAGTALIQAVVTNTELSAFSFFQIIEPPAARPPAFQPTGPREAVPR